MDVKGQIIQKFENRLWWQWFVAFLAGVLHKCAIWVGGGTITWATVVLMGGFASALPIHDIAVVTLLGLFIIILLAIVHVTCQLVTKKNLSTGSGQPLQLVYQDKRPIWVFCIKIGSSAAQFGLVSLIFWISVPKARRSKPILSALLNHIFSGKPWDDSAAGLTHLEACLTSCTTSGHHTTVDALQTCVQSCFPVQDDTATATINLHVCLFAFHLLVISTSILVCLCNFYILWRWMCFGGPKTLSLTRYHDEVLSRTLSNGLVNAGEFDEMDFLMQAVGEDLVRRKIAPLEVKRQNKDFIKYSLYQGSGVEMVMEMLASEDTLRQQTAANMPGFWSSEPEVMEKSGMKLLSRLGEKLGYPGKVAEGAANSFRALAVEWHENVPSPLLKVSVSRLEGQKQSFGAGDSSHAPVLAFGKVTSTSPAPMISTSQGGETTDTVSRSEGGMEGGGASYNAISRSGRGRHSAVSGSGGVKLASLTGRVEKEEFLQRGSISEAAEGEGSQISESNQTVASPGGEDGHGHSQQAVGGGGAGYESSNVVSGVNEPGGRTDESVFPSGGGSRGSGEAGLQGTGRGEASSGPVARTSGSRKNDGLKWNVVQKVVDLVANKRVPTLLVYVRALDAFFMSKSVRESLTEEEKNQINRKLRMIAQGDPNQGGSVKIGNVTLEVESSTKARTKLLAFSALERLKYDPHLDGNLEQLLEQVNNHLRGVEERSVIWIEEVRRYEELCNIYSVANRVDLQNSKNWKITGMDFLPM